MTKSRTEGKNDWQAQSRPPLQLCPLIQKVAGFSQRMPNMPFPRPQLPNASVLPEQRGPDEHLRLRRAFLRISTGKDQKTGKSIRSERPFCKVVDLLPFNCWQVAAWVDTIPGRWSHRATPQYLEPRATACPSQSALLCISKFPVLAWEQRA
jgi:hypothetical protein